MKEEELPELPFDMSNISKSEFNSVVRKGRSSSAPGPTATTYKVYKNCPLLSARLWRLHGVLWKKKTIPSSWGLAEGIFVPKEENSKGISTFRPISLLSVESKIFWSIISNRITTYMLKNHYINTTSQKGGIPGFYGCLEHNAMISEIIHHAKAKKKDLTMIWLDMANAYGSVPHQLVYTALDFYHIPKQVIAMIKTYFQHCKMRFTVNGFTTDLQDLEKGIMTGCTVSIIIFIIAMNIILKRAEQESRGPKVNDIRQPSCRAFVDDITVITESFVGGKNILKCLENLGRWARMSFKPGKSRSLVLLKGVLQQKQSLTIENFRIPTISEKPVKCLGKIYDNSLKDVAQIKEASKQLQLWLEQINKCLLPGRFKVWCYQFVLLPKLMWPLLVYEVPLTTAERMERAASRYLRKWLGVPPSFTNIGLYSNTAKLSLPISSITEEYKVGKIRAIATLRNSQDIIVRQSNPQVKTGRKWNAEESLSEAEARIQHKKIIGTICKGRRGLGFGTSNQPEKQESHRNQILQEVRSAEEEIRYSNAVQMGPQGAWTKWEKVVRRDIKWNELWKMTPTRARFLIRSVYDVLPTPSNLNVWGKEENPRCNLCDQFCTLEHILSSCPVSLARGLYTWRHNHVLEGIANVLQDEIKKIPKRKEKKVTFIAFQKAGKGGRKNNKKSTACGIIHSANDWKLEADLGKHMIFPTHIAHTTKRPDIVLYSDGTKQVVMVELTVPWETRVEVAYERKTLSYEELKSDCCNNGWTCWCFPIEVGCRGFPAQSLVNMTRCLGIQIKSRKKLLQDVSERAEVASHWIWMKHLQSGKNLSLGKG